MAVSMGDRAGGCITPHPAVGSGLRILIMGRGMQTSFLLRRI